MASSGARTRSGGVGGLAAGRGVRLRRAMQESGGLVGWVVADSWTRRLSGDAYEQALMDESVGDGACGCGVVEQVSPIFEGEVGGHDGGGAQIALVDDLVEQVGAAGIEAEITQLVDEQEVVGGPGREPLAQGVACLRGDEVVDEVGGECESHAIPLDAREVPEGVGEVGFSDPAGSDEDDVAALAHKVESGSALDDVAVDGGGTGE